jgi:hypothetical protein
METYYIRLNILPGGHNHAQTINGQSVAKNWAKLTSIARKLHIRALEDFVRHPGIAPKAKNIWFSPDEALVTIGKLISYISSDPGELLDARMLVRDLNDYANILSAASARSSKFQFATDFEPATP